MDRVRSHKQFGAWLGLAALALQLVLSFGHVHFTQTERAAIAVAAATNGKTFVEASRQSPAQKSIDDDDYCAICASIALVSSAQAALSPQLPSPDQLGRIKYPFDNAFTLIPPPRLAFQSRAPPAA
jgi:hypothetical protein